MSTNLWTYTEHEYVPTLAERIAEAIPTELTATPHVGIGGARRQKIANAVMPVVEAELAAVRAKVAEDIAAEILAKLDQLGLKPSPWAEGYTLAAQYAAAVARKHAA